MCEKREPVTTPLHTLTYPFDVSVTDGWLSRMQVGKAFGRIYSLVDGVKGLGKRYSLEY